jgi:hypothetical protein
MFEQGGGGRRGCLSFQLWIKGVYLVDNFWPVDKLWIVKKCEVIHRLCTVAKTQHRKVIHSLSTELCTVARIQQETYPQVIHIEKPG